MTSVLTLPDELQMLYDALTPPQRIAAQIVVVLNAAASPAYKSRYRRRWWQILEERVKLCALTSPDLARWSSCVSSRLGGQVGRNVRHREAWAELISQDDVEHTAVLDAMQHDTPVLVAFCRAMSDVARAAWETDMASGEEDV